MATTGQGAFGTSISVKTVEWAVEMMSTPVIMPLNGY